MKLTREEVFKIIRECFKAGFKVDYVVDILNKRGISRISVLNDYAVDYKEILTAVALIGGNKLLDPFIKDRIFAVLVRGSKDSVVKELNTRMISFWIDHISKMDLTSIMDLYKKVRAFANRVVDSRVKPDPDGSFSIYSPKETYFRTYIPLKDMLGQLQVQIHHLWKTGNLRDHYKSLNILSKFSEVFEDYGPPMENTLRNIRERMEHIARKKIEEVREFIYQDLNGSKNFVTKFFSFNDKIGKAKLMKKMLAFIHPSPKNATYRENVKDELMKWTKSLLSSSEELKSFYRILKIRGFESNNITNDIADMIVKLSLKE